MKKESGHPTEPKRKKRTPSLPTISIGKRDGELLKHLLELENKRFNLKKYSIINKIPRSTVYNILNRLERKEFVVRNEADNKITKKGEVYIEATNRCPNRGVASSRRECRSSGKLSTHYHTFTLPISDKSKFRVERLNTVENKGWKENRLANLHQVIVDFDDAKIVVNPKQIRINLFDVLSDNVDESDSECLSRALKYTEIIRKIGIETEGIMVERGHWARIESALSDFLCERVDGRYFLLLDDGKKFWVDHSPDKYGNPKREDETDSKLVRKRVDSFLNQIASKDLDLSDIDKIKDSLGFITKLESSRLMDKIEESKLKREKLKVGHSDIIKINQPTYIQ